MDKKYQKNLLKVLFQDSQSIYLIQYLDDDLFDLDEDKLLLSIYKSYIDKHKQIPTKNNFQQFVNNEFKENINPAIYTYLNKSITDVYRELPKDTNILKETLKTFSKRKQLKQLIKTETKNVNKYTDENFSQFLSRARSINEIGSDKKEHGYFFIGDFTLDLSSIINAHPCKYQGINNLTDMGGFFTPQLIILLKPPKSFGTGVLLNIALEYVKAGLNVFWADYENGAKAIRIRIAQYLLNSSKEDILKGKNRLVLKRMMKQLNRIGAGDIYVEEFKARHDTLNTVEYVLDKLWDEKKWKPDLIIYDYLDLAEAADSNLKERREKIQFNYHHAITINKKYECFSWSVSKVKREAFTKQNITVEDFGEDAEKAYNCHASFALCRTDEEIEKGLARIIPIVQRDGVSRRPDLYCLLDVDEEKQQATELFLND